MFSGARLPWRLRTSCRPRLPVVSECAAGARLRIAVTLDLSKFPNVTWGRNTNIAFLNLKRRNFGRMIQRQANGQRTGKRAQKTREADCRRTAQVSSAAAPQILWSVLPDRRSPHLLCVLVQLSAAPCKTLGQTGPIAVYSPSVKPEWKPRISKQECPEEDL